MQRVVPVSFAVTWDYRCPFARNAHEHVLDALADGADWDVTFLPFSLGQVHVEEGQPDVWDNPDADSGLTALQMGVAVRDTMPERFLDAARFRTGYPRMWRFSRALTSLTDSLEALTLHSPVQKRARDRFGAGKKPLDKRLQIAPELRGCAALRGTTIAAASEPLELAIYHPWACRAGASPSRRRTI